MSSRSQFVAAGTGCRSVVWPPSPSLGKLQAIPEFLTFVTTYCFLFLFLILSRSSSFGETDPKETTPTFRAGTDLVSVPVVVKDRRGNHVYGLTRNDFRIFENGHQVAISSFDSVTRQPPSAVAVGDGASRQTPLPQASTAAAIILFFDQLNTPADEQPGVRNQLARWYKGQQTLAASTCVILYTGSSLRIVQPPTVDAAKVAAAIESIPTTINSHGAGAAGDVPLPETAEENTPMTAGQLADLRSLFQLAYFWNRALGAGDTGSALIYAGRLFAAWPGEKALIWVSAGTTTGIETFPLQAAKVKLFPLNVHANIDYRFLSTSSLPDTTSKNETEVNHQLLENMREAAQETGGELCNNSFEPQSCVLKAMDDATDHYLLSYEIHARSSQPEWRQIRVKVDRPGVTVSARRGVMIAPALTTEEKKRRQIAAALASPADLPGLPLELEPFPPHQPGQELILSLLLRSDATHPGVWNAAATDFTVAGVVLCGAQVVQRFGEDFHGPLPQETISDLDAYGFNWIHEIVAPHDPARVRLVVRDNATGRIGSITRTLPSISVTADGAGPGKVL